MIGSTVDQVALTQSLTTDYVGNIIYENNALKRILVDGGYYESGNYYFYITDHLGNNRIVTNAVAAVVQSTQYYPFGASFADASGTSTQPYKYNGKELDQMHGLNLYDYSARYYESAIGRFTTVDPMAEMYYSISPYAYVGNNPIIRTDPTGMVHVDGKDRINPLTATKEELREYERKEMERFRREAMGGAVLAKSESPTDIVNVNGVVVERIDDGKKDVVHLSVNDVIVLGTAPSYKPSKDYPMEPTINGNSRAYMIGGNLVQIIDFTKEGAWHYSQIGSGSSFALSLIAMEAGIAKTFGPVVGTFNTANTFLISNNFNTISEAVSYAASKDSNTSGNVRMVIIKNLAGGNWGYQGPPSSAVVAATMVYTENGELIGWFGHSPE